MKQLFLVVLILSLLSGLTACTKNNFDETVIPLPETSKNEIVPQSFAFETADYMPGITGSQILVPWASGSNQAFPAEFVPDRKEIEGWVLVYNTFRDGVNSTNPPMMAIYNRYRGLLRTFFYHQPTAPFASDYLVHSLRLRDHDALKLLNYATNDVVDVTQTQTVASIMQPYQAAATGTWYAAEFELAYDPATSTLDATAYQLEWKIATIDVTDWKINGSSQGTITGTIAQPVSPTNFLGVGINGAVNLLGLQNINSMPGISTAFKNALKSFFNSGVQAAAKSILSAVLGSSGTGGATYYANLKTQATHELTGSMENASLISTPSFVIPGTANRTSVVGYTPLYREPLGVFTLSGRPQVNGEYQRTYRAGIPRGIWPQNFYLDEDSYEIVPNPAVIHTGTGGASIQNIQKEIVIFDEVGNINFYNSIYPEELINNKSAYIASATGDIQQPVREFNDGMDETAIRNYAFGAGYKPMINQYLRISFEVVPNDGSPRSKIVKTFVMEANATIID